jgi:hypothetical protein
MASPYDEGDAWWPPVEQEVLPKNLSLRCHDVIFRMTQLLASKDYASVLHAYTVCSRSFILLRVGRQRLGPFLLGALRRPLSLRCELQQNLRKCLSSFSVCVRARGPVHRCLARAEAETSAGAPGRCCCITCTAQHSLSQSRRNKSATWTKGSGSAMASTVQLESCAQWRWCC